MRVRERADVGPRCPYCRDPIAEEVSACGRCGVRLHEACARELGRCPTLGCQDPAAIGRVTGAGVQAARREDERASAVETAFSALPGCLVFGVGVALLLVPRLWPLAALTALSGLFQVAWVVERWLHVRARSAGLSVAPVPARHGDFVRLTLELGPALAARLRPFPQGMLRAELRCVDPGVAQTPARRWRHVLLAPVEEALRDGRAEFHFLLPPQPFGPGVEWEAELSCDQPVSYQEVFVVPVRPL